MAEEIVPLSSAQPTLLELADAVRQLQRLLAGVEEGEETDIAALLTRVTKLEDDLSQLVGGVTQLVTRVQDLELFEDSMNSPVISGGFGSGQQWAMNFGGLNLKGGLVPVPENQVVTVNFAQPFAVRCLWLFAMPISSGSLGGIPSGYFRETPYYNKNGFKLDNNRDSNWLWAALGI